MATFATKLMCLFLILGLASPSFATDIVNIDWSLEASLDLDLTLNVGDVVGKVFCHKSLLFCAT